MKYIAFVRIAVLIFSLTLLFSCSTVKQNGYYQTKRYNWGKVRLFDRQGINHVKQRCQIDFSGTKIDSVTANRVLDLKQPLHAKFKKSLKPIFSMGVYIALDSNKYAKPIITQESTLLPTRLNALEEKEESDPKLSILAILAFIISLIPLISTIVYAEITMLLFLFVVSGILGLIARNRILKYPEKYKGLFFAQAALTFSLAYLLLFVFISIFFVIQDFGL